MLAKGALIALVAVFGGLLFAAGSVAPDSWRSALGRLTEKAEKAAKNAVPAQAAKAPGADKAAPPEAEKKAPAVGSVPMPWSSLVVPVPAPQKGEYALLAGQFASQDDAEALAKRVRAAGLPVAVISAADAQERAWYVVAAGRYGSLEDARARRPLPASGPRLGPPEPLLALEPLPVILLPPPKEENKDEKKTGQKS